MVERETYQRTSRNLPQEFCRPQFMSKYALLPPINQDPEYSPDVHSGRTLQGKIWSESEKEEVDFTLTSDRSDHCHVLNHSVTLLQIKIQASTCIAT